MDRQAIQNDKQTKKHKKSEIETDLDGQDDRPTDKKRRKVSRTIERDRQREKIKRQGEAEQKRKNCQVVASSQFVEAHRVMKNVPSFFLVSFFAYIFSARQIDLLSLRIRSFLAFFFYLNQYLFHSDQEKLKTQKVDLCRWLLCMKDGLSTHFSISCL